MTLRKDKFRTRIANWLEVMKMKDTGLLSFVKVFPDGEKKIKTWKIKP